MTASNVLRVSAYELSRSSMQTATFSGSTVSMPPHLVRKGFECARLVDAVREGLIGVRFQGAMKSFYEIDRKRLLGRVEHEIEQAEVVGGFPYVVDSRRAIDRARFEYLPGLGFGQARPFDMVRIVGKLDLRFVVQVAFEADPLLPAVLVQQITHRPRTSLSVGFDSFLAGDGFRDHCENRISFIVAESGQSFAVRGRTRWQRVARATCVVCYISSGKEKRGRARGARAAGKHGRPRWTSKSSPIPAATSKRR